MLFSRFIIFVASAKPLWLIIRIAISIHKFHVAIINVSTWYKHLDKRNENISKFPLKKQESSRYFNLTSQHSSIRIKDITNTCALKLFMMFDILLLEAIKNFTFHSPTKSGECEHVLFYSLSFFLSTAGNLRKTVLCIHYFRTPR